VEEQSHKEEMRAALRADFERLHARARPPVAAEHANATTATAAKPTDSKDDHPFLARLLRRG